MGGFHLGFDRPIDEVEAPVATALDAAATGAPVSALHGSVQTFIPGFSASRIRLARPASSRRPSPPSNSSRAGPARPISSTLHKLSSPRHVRQSGYSLGGQGGPYIYDEYYDEDSSSFPLTIPGGDDIVERSDTPFNTCAGGLADALYGALIHESGHALGITEGDVPDGWDSSLGAHPLISGSIMNYDELDLTVPMPRPHPGTVSLPKEDDCSPHPFDVMAVYALYQTTPRVTISGPKSGTEMSEVKLEVSEISKMTSPYFYEWWSVEPRGLTLTPNRASNPAYITLPAMSIFGPVERGKVTVEVIVTDSNGRAALDRHVITVMPRVFRPMP